MVVALSKPSEAVVDGFRTSIQGTIELGRVRNRFKSVQRKSSWEADSFDG